ncbi:tyrosine-protein phosphatase [Streptomyces sp. NPDC050504]|uniref:tyrosine-protein phosphatase n=1 Tax=Streptomyces sp. NPDC050504 TaxID=3365618 RepID=UPI0037BBB22D
MNDLRNDLRDALTNYRDLGGLETATATVRPGVLCRSASPASLDTAGRAALRGAVSLVIDLRSEREAVAAPAAVHPVTVRLPLLDGDAPALSDIPTLSELYRGLLGSAGDTFARVAQLVADQADGAVLVHCTAGKDRTGIAVALLLDAVGADREAIIADYALSETRLSGAWADGIVASVRAMGVEVTPRMTDLITRSPGHVMAETLDHLDARYGGTVAYLRAHGLDDHAFEKLTRRLLPAR